MVVWEVMACSECSQPAERASHQPGLYEGVVVLMVLYGAETWNMGAAQRRLNVMEVRCLRSMCAVTQMDQVRNDEMRTGVVKELAEQAEQGVLQWFGHLERMEEECLVKKITRSDLRGLRPRGRP